MVENNISVLQVAKKGLSTDQRQMFDQEYGKYSKSIFVCYLLWFLFGLIGLHKFYVRKTGIGVLYIFTGGLFLLGWVIDILLIPSQVQEVNETIAKETILEVKMLTKE